MKNICSYWEFTEVWTEDFLHGKGTFPAVRLPHTVREVPQHYATPADYEMICGYRRTLDIPADAAGKRLFLQFDGAAHIAELYVNGKKVADHSCGYTAFRAEITEHIRFGASNAVAVRLDSTENKAVPPFGFVIDYLTYGGLYREAWLDILPQTHISDIFVYTPTLTDAKIAVTTEGTVSKYRCRVLDAAGDCVADADSTQASLTLSVPGAKPWNNETPNLYTCEVSIFDQNGQLLHTKSDIFGFRTAEFRTNGFYLNGKKTFLRGLNRHQCYPYLGYAAPERLQREDARILKHELACTAVRTSHYPQSQHFIDECDRLGLLVFTEIPGWQHVGDDAWKRQAMENTREMVLQYRNHPSIVLWGVRINESQDDEAFYVETNRIAHGLDPSRPTSGVRYILQSQLLEDVYAFNDFSHTGDNAPIRQKKSVTPDQNKSFLISEHGGHMFPTKSYDPWSKRQEQAMRHARVLGAAMSSGEHAGCFGWCMFDYPTHKDFGSGDRVCYHGVLDAFRNPKPAAAVYAAQGQDSSVLEVISTLDIGDYPGGQLGDVVVFSNADSVEFYKNDNYVTTLEPDRNNGLIHPPMPVSDTVGQLLESQEGFSPRKAALLRDCLLGVSKSGLAKIPMKYKLKLGYAAARYKVDFAEAARLYGKYIGNWGESATVWRFDGKKDGKVVSSVTRAPGSKLHLEVRVGETTLQEGECCDMTSVRVRILDEYGAVASYAQQAVTFTLTGAAALVGPEAVAAEGGMCGTYVKTVEAAGTATLTVKTDRCEPITVNFVIKE